MDDCAFGYKICNLHTASAGSCHMWATTQKGCCPNKQMFRGTGSPVLRSSRLAIMADGFHVCLPLEALQATCPQHNPSWVYTSCSNFLSLEDIPDSPTLPVCEQTLVNPRRLFALLLLGRLAAVSSPEVLAVLPDSLEDLSQLEGKLRACNGLPPQMLCRCLMVTYWEWP